MTNATDVGTAAETGAAGLRWAVVQPLPDDSAHSGSAGVLRALCEARLSGLTEFDAYAAGHRDRLLGVRLAPRDSTWPREITGSPEDTSLYIGAAGRAAALRCWADAAHDATAAAAAAQTAGEVAAAELSPLADVLLGDAGALLELVAAGEREASGRYADALVAASQASGAGLDWTMAPGLPFVMPNFSHGTAGVAFALARAAALTERPDLLEAARSGARRLTELGQQPDGSLAVPHSVPQQEWAAPQSWGWCHGPTGTVQLFLELSRHDEQWQQPVDASLRALRGSGLPERLQPGFWDNHGQCCGTAGVGELALDRYQATGNADWLAWSDQLAANLVGYALPQDVGVAWSNLEHTAAEPDLPPEPGWMQGAAGIASYLLRHARVHRDGRDAARVPWPDRV